MNQAMYRITFKKHKGGEYHFWYRYGYLMKYVKSSALQALRAEYGNRVILVSVNRLTKKQAEGIKHGQRR